MTSDYEMYKDVRQPKEVYVHSWQKATLIYDTKNATELNTMLKQHGVLDGVRKCRRTKPAKEGTVELGDVLKNKSNGGCMDLKRTDVGVAMYIPPLKWKNLDLPK